MSRSIFKLYDARGGQRVLEGLEWMHTPETVTTTRAPAVLKIFQIGALLFCSWIDRKLRAHDLKFLQFLGQMSPWVQCLPKSRAHELKLWAQEPMSFVIIPKKDPKKLQNLWAPSLTTVHISLVGWDQGDGGSANDDSCGETRSQLLKTWSLLTNCLCSKLCHRHDSTWYKNVNIWKWSFGRQVCRTNVGWLPFYVRST